MLGHKYEPEMGLGRNENGIASLVEFTENRGRFGLGYKPTHANMRRITLARRERSSIQPQRLQVEKVPFCHFDESFISVGWMCEGWVAVINEETPQDQPIWVQPCPLEFELGNWRVIQQPGISMANSIVPTLLLGLGFRVCFLFGHIFLFPQIIKTHPFFI